MLGRFAHLKPDEGNRTAFWEENVGRIKELLDEVNNDVFNGKGNITSKHDFVLYNPHPPLIKPALFLKTNKGTIAVCVSKEDGYLTLIAARPLGSFKNLEWWLSYPKTLDKTLEEAIKFLIE